MRTRWRFGLIAGIFLALFSLYPQINLMIMRGAEYNGNYAYNDIDEVAYASYVKALIDGRPRKNDPYTGRDDSPEDPQPESLFSIQFAAPFTIALPARMLGIGAPWAMTIAGAIAAFLTALAVFWIIRMMTGDDWFAMAGSLVTLVGGAVFAGEGAMSEIFFGGFSYPYFPGFRRYIPALAMPAFFALVGLVWKLFGRPSTSPESPRAGAALTRENLLVVVGAVAAFGYCVYSYFYIWTAAAAWLGCLGVVLIAIRPAGVLRDVKLMVVLGAGCALALVPYVFLLSHRSHTMDEVQLLVRTHAPDLTRPPEIIAFVVIASLILGWGFRVFEADRRVIFVGSLAAAVFAVFNQQIITGQALQPIHYQVFIGNYIAGLSLVLAVGIYLERFIVDRKRALRLAAGGVALIAVTWGFIECFFTSRVLDEANALRDRAVPVARRLTEIAGDSPDRHRLVVMPFDIAVGDDLPTLMPEAVLWARHQHVFAGVTWQENKERYYQYLYYQGVEPDELAESMKYGGDFVSIIALFGWGRHTDRLNSDRKPLTYGELDGEALLYADYLKNFDPHTAGDRPLDFAVAAADREPDWEHIDLWYDRDAGEKVGDFILYRLKLR